MKLHSGLVLSSLLSLGLLTYACANGDTVSGSTGSGGSNPSGNTGGSSSNNTGGSSSNTGGSGNGNTTGNSGGSHGSGGVHGTGGATGGSNVTGSGGTTTGSSGGTTGTTGTGGSTASSCVLGASNPPSVALITDFSDAKPSTTSTGNFTFGATAGQMGGTSLYPSSTNGMLSTGSGGLTFEGTVAAPTTANMYPYTGVVVFLNGPACVNASMYTGVSFTISGSGACNVVFAFVDKEHTAATDDAMRGSCTGTCYAGQYSVTVPSSAATVKMPFSGTPTSPGVPVAAVDPMNLTGVEWQLGQAATATSTCMETLTITNVSFY